MQVTVYNAFKLIFACCLLIAVGALLWRFWAYRSGRAVGSWFSWAAVPLCIVLFLCISVYFLEPNWIAVERVHVAAPRLAGLLAGVKVVQLSDLHVRREIRFRERSLIRKVNALKPDIVLITGDILERPEELFAAQAVLRGIESRHGIFIVPGNTDYQLRRSFGKVMDTFRADGVTVLINQSVLVPLPDGRQLRLAGVDDPVTNRALVGKALQGIPPGEPVLLMAHSPDVYAQAVLAGVDLLVVGHTHGGQIGIPWLIRKSAYANRAYRMSGLTKDGTTTMYVNRGIGTKSVPLRLLCRPEITEFVFD